MKGKFTFNVLLILSLWVGGVLFLTGCKKDPVVPVLTTTDASDITINTAKTGGNITSDGGAEVTSRGVCWGTASQPLITGLHTSDSKGNGSFSSSLTGLTPGTTYYIRAYASNIAGTAYGNELSFTTVPLVLPQLTTTAVTGITSVAAVSGGNITSDGGAEVTVRGICWGPDPNPTTDNNKTTSGSGTGSFSANIAGLNPATTYHVRAYATNSVGTAYGNDISFTTLAVPPTLTTAIVTNVTFTSAVTGGNITSNGGAVVTARGVCWSKTHGPVASGPHTSDGSGSGVFSSSITGLDSNTEYFVRAYAVNSAGTSYGNELSFTTRPVSAPDVTTSAVTGVAVTTAVSGGNVTNDNGGVVTERGVCWNTTGNPTIAGSKTSDGTGTGGFSSTIASLTAGTVYYVRAYATNSAGTGYGSQIRFSTSVPDADGNIYRTVLIGTQLWMQSDLKTTSFSDNSPIPYVPDNEEWRNLITPGYSWYDTSPSYRSTFGILYNWYAVETGELCPSGWHVASDQEFKTMEINLGMSPSEADGTLWRGTDEGTQLKYTATWYPSSGNGTNSSGFAALGGGYRYGLDGGFAGMGVTSYWWTSDLHWSDTTKALYRRLDSGETQVHREGVSKAGGKFVRCLKN